MQEERPDGERSAGSAAAESARRPPIATPFLSAAGLTRRFGPVLALDGVSINFHPGEIHGVIGENGAGKSTFLKLLVGLERPDAGTISVEGHPVTPRSAAEAARLGVVLIHQELSGVPDLSVSANLFLGREPVRHGSLDLATMRADSLRLLARVGGGIDPDARLGDLSVALQQRVEIAKALSFNARLLLFDEPTAVLPADDCARLFTLLRELRASGAAIAFVSHHLDEVVALSDRVSVLRDGRLVHALGPFGPGTSRPTERELAALMVGRDLGDYFPARAPVPAGAPVALEVRGWTTADVTDISLDVRGGEILGLAGLVGAGRTELAESLFGLRSGRGELRLFGAPYRPRSPLHALRSGIAYLPEDRKGAGLHVALPLAANATLAALRAFGTWWLQPGREREAALRAIQELAIRAAGPDAPVSSLSGGNQQKVLLAKWLATGPRVLLVDEPTRGVDIGAKREIYRLLARLAADGAAIVLISSELNELLGLCHRIAVLRRGRLAGVLDAASATDRAVMELAAVEVPRRAHTGLRSEAIP